MSGWSIKAAVALGAAACGLLVACSQEPSTSTVEVPWILVRSAPTSSTVDVQYFHGACDAHPRARVDPTTTTVRITVSVQERNGVACPAMGIVSYARVRLGSALGNRTILGSCNFSASKECAFGRPFAVPKHLPVLGS